MAKSESNAIYQQIAMDIAQRIVNGEYAPGAKLHGRSTLSSKYNVSAETIRRSLALLEEMDVLRVVPSSGIVVNTVFRARNYIERFTRIHSISSLQNELNGLLTQKAGIEDKLNETMRQIISYSHQLKNITPYNPVEVKVPPHSHAIGKTISELRFWQNTGGTVVALRTGGELLVSPGPYAIISEGDAIVVVGNAGILEDVERYVALQTPSGEPACPNETFQPSPAEND